MRESPGASFHERARGPILVAMKKVRVGVVDQGKEEKLKLYLDALLAAGADVTVLRWQTPRDAAADAGAFDAIVLCGGDDVDARLWGEQNHPSVELVPPARDAYEVAIVRAAVDRGVPLLGVCRGSQVMNVALGGSLEQHVPDVPGRGPHGGGTLHSISIEPGSLLSRLARGGAVNSFHHQAVGRLAPGLTVSARSADGGVEAVEGPGLFCLGVQWHPERAGNDPGLGPELFRALVEAGEKARTPGGPRSSKG
jgi:gamma-glutamyl-gamma-aminobutyrate hydrolase PuuD